MREYYARCLATIIPAGVTIEQVISGGNLLLATCAGLLAVLAGRWALRKQRLEAEVAELKKQQAELELAAEYERQRTKPPFVTERQPVDGSSQ